MEENKKQVLRNVAFEDRDKVILGTNIKIGRKTKIAKGVVIGNDTVIGSECTINANVIIGNNCKIPAKSIIYAGVVIGNHCVFKRRIDIGSNQIIQSGTISNHLLTLPDKNE